MSKATQTSRVSQAEKEFQNNNSAIGNSERRDSFSKIIFEDPTLCVQFLKGYLDIPLLKDVQPEDIEDVTNWYVHLFSEERNSDVIKKVHIKAKSFRYPPILPIVFYDGRENWTAAVRLHERVLLSDILGEYIPDYHCILMQLKEYSNAELIKREDVLSVVMMLTNLHGHLIL